ncbi:MAG: lipopolysaccharide heptosyltransferase II [Nitrospirae bacterium]|nr:lipopolysaccharide heptosyltransferase II [Nitrospirota bacterium]
MSNRNKAKILIRGVNWIGDAVMTIPAIRAIKKNYPDSKLHLLIKPFLTPVFNGNPDIDEIIPYEDKFRGIVGRFRLAGLLRRRGFSKAILFQNAFDAALVAFFADVPERIGYNRDGRGLLLTRPVEYNREDRRLHHIDYYLSLLKKAGMRAEFSFPWIFLSLEERLSARKRLLSLKRPILGINPGAAYGSAKRWMPERFAEIACWFIKDTGGSVIIFGSIKDAEIAYEIKMLIKKQHFTPLNNHTQIIQGRSLFSLLYQRKVEIGLEESEIGADRILNLAGLTDLRDLIALISECDVFISNDSGPMHIAYAVGAPLVAIFGSTDPMLTGPISSISNYRVLNPNLSCSPCFDRVCKDNDLRCMYAITSEEAYFSIKDILPQKRAVFFDRDGTLCRDADYLNDWNDFKVFHDINELNRLKDKGFLLIGISNQSGISRGIVEESFVIEVNNLFINKYNFDDFYYCPHHPDEHCPCRKPEPGMLFKARAKHMIDLKESYVIGDKDSDMLLAKAVGAKGILIKTGKQKDSIYADLTSDDIKEAVQHILSIEKGKCK